MLDETDRQSVCLTKTDNKREGEEREEAKLFSPFSPFPLLSEDVKNAEMRQE